MTFHDSEEASASLGKTIALLDCIGVCTPNNTLFLFIVKVRSCGQVHNSESCYFEPDTSFEFVKFQDWPSDMPTKEAGYSNLNASIGLRFEAL